MTIKRHPFYSTPDSTNPLYFELGQAHKNTVKSSKHTIRSHSIDTNGYQSSQSKTSIREQPGQDSQMAPRTIAERAAAGEIQSVNGLTREEQGELLIWARSQDIPYLEIIRRYGFTQSETALRNWRHQIVNNRPPRVAVFTPEDVCFPSLTLKLLTTTDITYSPYTPCMSLHYMNKLLIHKPCCIGRAYPPSRRTLRNRSARRPGELHGHLEAGPRLHPQERRHYHRRSLEAKETLGRDCQPGRRRPAWPVPGSSCPRVPCPYGRGSALFLSPASHSAD